MKYELESKTYHYLLKMQMSAMLEKTSGFTCLLAINVLFFNRSFKTLHVCYKFIDLALNGLLKRNAATFDFLFRQAYETYPKLAFCFQFRRLLILAGIYPSISVEWYRCATFLIIR